MDSKLAYWGSVIFSVIALGLVVTNITLSNANRTLQTEVSQRQNAINGGQTLGQLNQGLVQAMAEAAYKNNDTQLRDLLASQNITVKTDPAAADNASAAKAKK